MTSDATFILRIAASGPGPRLAVKDNIAVAGLPMTAGSQALAETAEPSPHDAACMAGARAAGAQIVGLTNLHELAFGGTGINPYFGTPVNPFDPGLIPGGSSSGSAVAVANDEADIAFGTDTTGSIRTPAACCGVVGLKTTYGRIPVQGVYPLATTLDTVGPMGKTIDAVVRGMALLEPGFQMGAVMDPVVGRFRLPTDRSIDAAIDGVLRETDFQVVDVDLPNWKVAHHATSTIANAEGWLVNRDLFHRSGDKLGRKTRDDLALAQTTTPAAIAGALAIQSDWQDFLRDLFKRVDVIAMPTLTTFPPSVDSATDIGRIMGTQPWSLAGVPALALPLRSGGPIPASLQLVAPWNHEERLLAVGWVIEAASSTHGS